MRSLILFSLKNSSFKRQRPLCVKALATKLFNSEHTISMFANLKGSPSLNHVLGRTDIDTRDSLDYFFFFGKIVYITSTPLLILLLGEGGRERERAGESPDRASRAAQLKCEDSLDHHRLLSIRPSGHCAHHCTALRFGCRVGAGRRARHIKMLAALRLPFRLLKQLEREPF